MKVLIVCVHYRSGKWTQRYLEQIAALPDASSIDVVVVDNSSREGRFEPRDVGLGGRLQVVAPPENLGYLGGAAFGFETYLKNGSHPDWVIVSNVDLAFDGEDFLPCLAQHLGDKDIGVLVPSIRSGLTGHEQNPYLRVRPPAARMRAYRWLFALHEAYVCYAVASLAFRHIRAALGGLRPPAPAVPAEGSVYAAHGSFLIFSRSYFERGGTLGYPCFLFGEEIFVAETCRAIGLRAHFEPRLRIRHEEHVSTGKVCNRAMSRYLYRSTRFCVESYF